jgi:MFS family permease
VAVGAYVGATVMVLTQVAMTAIMTMTPVHMLAHDHQLGSVGLVIGLHIAAMFLPSPLTGMLVDRVGRTPMAVAAGLTLLAAGGVAALAPGDSLGPLILALVLLGLGWNFGLIAGTALVIDATVPGNRARGQGSVDVLIALAGAGGGVMSGVVVAATDYAFLSLSGGLLALLLVPVLVWARRSSHIRTF